MKDTFMQSLISSLNGEYSAILERYKGEVVSLSVGRATPALVEDFLVEAYNQKMRLKELASISTPDFKTIIIQPWDKGAMEAIAQSLTASLPRTKPSVQENRIVITIPPLTEEVRNDILKILHKRTEEARILMRKKRDEARNFVNDAERKKEISEDEKFRLQKKIQEIIDDHTKKVEAIESNKEREIKTV